ASEQCNTSEASIRPALEGKGSSLHVVVIIAVKRRLGDLGQVAWIGLYRDGLRICAAIDDEAHDIVAGRERGNMSATVTHGRVRSRRSGRMAGIDGGRCWTARITAGIERRLEIEGEAMHARGGRRRLRWLLPISLY